MNTRPSRAWLLSLVLVTACAAGAEPGTETTDDSNLDRTTTETPVPSTSGTPAAPAPTTAAGELDVAPPAPPSFKVLNIVWQRQETGYWCGPGTTRIVISTRETDLPTQTTLAKELGTTTNGTDHVSQMVDLLNQRWKLTGADAYVSTDISDPPTPAQRAQLKKDIVKRINAGYGIVANVVSGWRPPTYPATGTFYHYVAVVGYDENGDKALIADPAGEGGQSTAFSKVPRTYWVSTEDLGTWIGMKGYTG